MTDNQPAANTDRELYREPSPEGSFGMEYYQPSVHGTAQGTIGMSVGGLVVVQPIKRWHQAAQIAATLAKHTCLDCGHYWDAHAQPGDGNYPPLGCCWPDCGCRESDRRAGQ